MKKTSCLLAALLWDFEINTLISPIETPSDSDHKKKKKKKEEDPERKRKKKEKKKKKVEANVSMFYLF